MGHFAGKTFAELTESRWLPVGEWLNDASSQHPMVSPKSLLAGAFVRLDFVALLKGVVTFTGGSGSVAAAKASVLSKPSTVTYQVRGDGLEIQLGCAMVIPNGLKQCTDWAFRLTLSPDNRNAYLQVHQAATSNDVLANARVFRSVLEGLADVLADGVAVDAVTVTNPTDLLAAFSPATSAAIKRVVLRPRQPIWIDADLADVLPIDLLERAIAKSARASLATTGAWPLLELRDGRFLVRANEERSIRMLGAMVSLLQTTSIGPALRSKAESVLTQLEDVDEWFVDEIDAQPSIAAETRFLPLVLTGESTVGSDALVAMLASTCDVRMRVAEFRSLGRIPPQNVFWQAAVAGSTASYKISRSYQRSRSAEPVADALIPGWVIDAVQGSVAPSTSRREVALRIEAMSFSVAPTLQDTAGLVTLLSNAAEVLLEMSTGEIPPTLWRVDRRRGWGQKSDSVAHSDSPAAWHPDPQQRHQLRYWNGAHWTSHVSDSGFVSVDHAG